MNLKKFKTEKMLLASIAFIFMFLLTNIFAKEIIGVNVSLADENSVTNESSQNEDSQNNESSQDEEDSQEEKSQENEDSQSEKSQIEEKSQPSVASTPKAQVSPQRKSLSQSETSQKSIKEASQKSQTSETQEPSEASQQSSSVDEVSEKSIKYVEGYGEIVSKEGNVALVKKDEKLFYLIPVDVESQVTLDEQGAVINEKKNFFNWLLSVLSF